MRCVTANNKILTKTIEIADLLNYCVVNVDCTLAKELAEPREKDHAEDIIDINCNSILI